MARKTDKPACDVLCNSFACLARLKLKRDIGASDIGEAGARMLLGSSAFSACLEKGPTMAQASLTTLDSNVVFEVGMFLCSRLADVASLVATCSALTVALGGKHVCDLDVTSSGSDSELIEDNCTLLTFASFAWRSYPGAVASGAPSGQALLSIVSTAGRPDVVRFLLANTRDCTAAVNEQDVHGATALHYAALEGHDHVCRILLEAGASVNMADGDGVRPLHLAAESCRPCTIATLITSQAELNARDKSGNTAILIAAERGDELACTMLAAAGASHLLSNHRGKTALSIAGEEGSRELVRALLQPPSLEKAFAEASWLVPGHNLAKAADGGSHRDDLSRGLLAAIN